MNTRRLSIAGLAVLAGAGLALSACSSGSTGTPTAASSTSPSPSASPTPLTPEAALAAGIANLKTTGFDFTLTQGPGSSSTLTGTGSCDPATKAATESETGTEDGINVTFGATQIGPQLWAKFDLGTMNAQAGVPTTWMLLDQSKLGAAGDPFDFTTDPLDITGLMTSVTGLSYKDATTIAGDVDLTASTGVNAPDSSSLSADGTAPKTTPFTATLDASGQITELDIDTTAYDPSIGIVLKVSDYGSQAAINPPSGNVAPAPAAAYTFINGS